MGFTPNSGIPSCFILSCFPDRTMPSVCPFRSSYSWAVKFLSAYSFRDEVACTCHPVLTWTQDNGSTPRTASERDVCEWWQQHIRREAVNNILSRTELIWDSFSLRGCNFQYFLFFPMARGVFFFLESWRVALLPLFFYLLITMHSFSHFATLIFDLYGQTR